jgi:hypothetical protein
MAAMSFPVYRFLWPTFSPGHTSISCNRADSSPQREVPAVIEPPSSPARGVGGVCHYLLYVDDPHPADN